MLRTLWGGPQLSEEDQKLVRQWRDVIVQIAREEMAHWVTVENILTSLDAPLNFEREDFSIPWDLYPFAFELEPLTKRSLGKHVLAEMPAEDVVRKLGLEKEIDEIRKYVGSAAVHHMCTVHRVGIIYGAIIGAVPAAGKSAGDAKETTGIHSFRRHSCRIRTLSSTTQGVVSGLQRPIEWNGSGPLYGCECHHGDLDPGRRLRYRQCSDFAFQSFLGYLRQIPG
jgi:hypothetical protein